MPYDLREEQGRPVTIKDEGVTLTTNVASIDFAGAGVTGTTIGDAVTETIPGGGGGTPGGSNTQFQYNNAGAFGGTDWVYDNVTTNAAIGTTVNALYNVNLQKTQAPGAGALSVGFFNLSTSTPTGAAASHVGTFSRGNTTGVQNVAQVAGGQFSGRHSGSGTGSDIVGVVFDGDHNGTNTVTNLYGSWHRVNSLSSGTTTFSYGAFIRTFLYAAGNIGDAYQIYMADPFYGSTGRITNLYGIYAEPQTVGTGDNYFIYYNNTTSGFYVAGDGKTGIGVVSPTFRLDVGGDQRISATTNQQLLYTNSTPVEGTKGIRSEISSATGTINYSGFISAPTSGVAKTAGTTNAFEASITVNAGDNGGTYIAFNAGSLAATSSTAIGVDVGTGWDTGLRIQSGGATVVGSIRTDTSLIVEETGAGTDTITIQAPASIGASYTLTLPVDDGGANQVLTTDGSGVLSWTTPAGSGDFVGPASATDNAIVRFDGATGKLGQNSGVLVDDSSNISPVTNDVGALGTTSLKWADLFLADGGVINFNSGDVVLTHSANTLTMSGQESFAITQAAATTGAPTGLTFTGGAHTGLTASTNVPAVHFNIDQTVQHATGALTTQTAVLIDAPTYSFVGASTLSTASTVHITGAPFQGTNASIESAYGLSIDSSASGAALAASLSIAPQGIANGVGATQAVLGIAVADFGTNIAAGNQTATTDLCFGIGIIAPSFESITNVRTFTTAASLYVSGAPRNNGNIVFTDGPYAVLVESGISKIAGSVEFGYEEKTANYTPSTDDHIINCTTNSFDITLPTAVGKTGRRYTIKNSGSGKTITMKTTSAQTMDGVASGAITLAYRDSYTFVSDGANWIIV